MINSNYYGLVGFKKDQHNKNYLLQDAFCQGASHKQSARAANSAYAALLFRRQIERSQISPVR
jgi:hypothetical protein